MIESPVVGTISSMLFSFNSRSQSYLEPFPQFVGESPAPPVFEGQDPGPRVQGQASESRFWSG